LDVAADSEYTPSPLPDDVPRWMPATPEPPWPFEERPYIPWPWPVVPMLIPDVPEFPLVVLVTPCTPSALSDVP
jgi:hypothetical protein